ncbi:MAG: hypothetical protein P8X74_22070 [Reinekea sp.]
MKVFLDDERVPPEGWVLVRWPSEAIELLKKHEVQEISLDHDLGNDEIGTGYDVILWLEEQVAIFNFLPPVITIHSANTSARRKMLAGVENIYKLARENQSQNFKE